MQEAEILFDDKSGSYRVEELEYAGDEEHETGKETAEAF